jgi:DNA-binding transcriptional MerR regulator
MNSTVQAINEKDHYILRGPITNFNPLRGFSANDKKALDKVYKYVIRYTNMKLYTQHEVANITDIPANTIQGWVKDGLIRLSFSPHVSRGIPRTYIASDIVELAIVKKLSDLGCCRRLIKKLAHFLQEIAPGRLEMSYKKKYLNPDRIDARVVFTLELRDDEWHIAPRDKTSQPAPNILDIMKSDTILVIININRIVEKLGDRL